MLMYHIHLSLDLHVRLLVKIHSRRMTADIQYSNVCGWTFASGVAVEDQLLS